MADQNPGAVGWKVENQVQGIEMGAGGQFVRGYTINFVTDSGIRGSVFLPLTEYNSSNMVQNVRAKIAEHAAQLEMVHALKG